jgi:hypothetical protein
VTDGPPALRCDLSPPPDVRGEQGWCGIYLHPETHSLLATVHSSAAAAVLWDTDRPVQSIFLTASCSAAAWDISAAPLLYACEGSALGLHDMRARSAASRCMPAPGNHLFAVAPAPIALAAADHKKPRDGAAAVSSSSPYVFVGGQDRTVYVVDTRRWTVLERWRGSISHPITRLFAGSVAPGGAAGAKPAMPVLVSNIDNMLVAGRADTGGRGWCHRAVGRWLGMAALGGRDLLAGVTDAGMAYVYRGVFAAAAAATAGSGAPDDMDDEDE